MSGGTFDVDSSFGGQDFEFSGGTINVAGAGGGVPITVQFTP
jgi:hypothetical protein